MPLRIIFMGTPDFAVPSLDILYRNGYDIAAVITSTDKLGGRGKKKLIESAVKKYAINKGFNVLQPPNLKNLNFIEDIRTLKADLQVVVAFRMLPEIVWNMPPLGTMNLHGSLLPKYRGAAPINWAIINGEKETGLTTFLLKHKIDTGDMLFQHSIPIDQNDTAGTVHDRMKYAGAELLLKSVIALENGTCEPMAQNPEIVSKAPKIFHKTCEINFDQSLNTVHNFIRGLSPYPTAWTMIGDKTLHIFRAEKIMESHKNVPGMILSDNKSYIKISTADAYVNILELQLQGKKKMSVKDFLNGFDLSTIESITKMEKK